ncbi:integrase, catalytic region, zinc finger, CCHC-type containing protein [Tanacetum coccineum]|uniref:Integrase, catalytic region, zinc finger, CCHC-type containing protein n=1 Tax=Tanacetum coccineum TaxID=301880 RepID=A0ABQ5AA86_9ASTR
MTNPITTSTTDSQMPNNILEAGSRDRPPMLVTGRYAQWQSHFLRYIDTRPNGDALRKCILKGPYTSSTIIIPDVPATNDSPEVPKRTAVETILNMSPENKAHYESEKESIHLLLTGIGDEIYSTVDCCKTTHDMWISIERLQQGESLNIQDVKTNLFWEFGKFTSHDGESMESYYSRSLLSSTKISQTICTAIKTIIFHQISCIYQYKGKEIAKLITPLSELASEEDSDPKQAQRDKDMQKNMELIAKYFKKIYKPTNNNLRTSSNSRNKNVDTSPSQVVQQTGIQCFNCKEFGHFAKECRKPKRVKDYSYHKEKMLLCKQVEKGVPLQAEQADWLEDTDEEIDEQELEAHYSYMAKIQEVPASNLGTDTEPLEQVDSNVIPDSLDMCDNDIQADQNAVECYDERATLDNLIANLKLDVDENKKI